MNILTILATGKKELNSTINNLPNKDGFNLTPILNAVYVVAGLVAVIYIVVAGIQYVTSNGNPEKAKKALHTIIYALCGLVIVLIAAALTNLVFNTAGDAMSNITITEPVV